MKMALEKETELFENQVTEWKKQIATEPEKVAAEVAVDSFMLLYNIDANISLIRDLIANAIQEKNLQDFEKQIME